MTRFSDKRGLPVCYLRDNGALLLNDETAQAYSEGDYPMMMLELPNFDMELSIYNLTRQSGGNLPPEGEVREKLRGLIRAVVPIIE